MNIDNKKSVYEVIMLFWSALKDFIFSANKDYDKYIESIGSKYEEYEKGDKYLFLLYKELTSAFCHYLEGKDKGNGLG